MMTGDHRKDCCKQERNLSESFSYGGRVDITYRRCRVCGCRHFEAVGEPGNFGVVMLPMHGARE